jgi:hypothetical protein
MLLLGTIPPQSVGPLSAVPVEQALAQGQQFQLERQPRRTKGFFELSW